MNKNKTKTKQILYLRYAVQIFGILLTIIGFFNGYPIMNLIFLGITIMMGPVFCGWICPFGTLQDVFSKLGKILGIKTRVLPIKLKKTLVFSRYILLLVTVFISADFIFSLLSYDPRANFTLFLGGNTIAILGWSVIAFFLIISMIFERPFCNYLCIEGAKKGLMGTLRPITIKRNESTCINCGKCNRACPMNIDISSYGQVRSLQCINCMECVSACPVSNTLTVGLIPFKKKSVKLILTIITIIVLSVSALLVYTNNDNNNLNIGSLFNSLESDTTSSISIAEENIIEIGNASGIADGIYEGTGTGFRGAITVEVTVENELIKSIEVTEKSDDDKWFNRAYSTVTSDIINNQTTEVDSVSGATYSSMGIKEAVANALINAGGENVETIINDLPVNKKSHEKK
jgi:uncharacterized protein with FMN-binding domain/NAD-dependent dihydropyrimidine dehydrogenase PreA subunit